jgi:two-component system KDP operon response regulator KdpE
MSGNAALPVGVLIVEDDPAIGRFLRTGLSAQGYAPEIVVTGAAALARVTDARQGIELIVLDLGLPDMDGLQVITRLRAAGCLLPIIVLTARDTEAQKVAALDAGADDYVTKPFGIEELYARLRAAQRHRLQREGAAPIFRTGGLTLDLVRREVSLNGAAVHLTPKEYELLCLLARHAGKVLTQRMILNALWAGDSDIPYLRIYIRTLRQKIETDPARPAYLVTETGVGYRLRLIDPPETGTDPAP